MGMEVGAGAGPPRHLIDTFIKQLNRLGQGDPMNKTALKQTVIVLVTAVTLLIIATSTGGAAPVDPIHTTAPAPPGFTVTLGIVAPLSGDLVSFGEATRDGALVAIEDAQAAGWNIEVLYGDSQCDATEAVSVTNDLITNHGVDYIIGAVCSSASIPMSELTEPAGVVQIAPPSTAPIVTKYEDGTNKEYVFRACFLDPFQGKVMATVAKEDLSATTAAVLYNGENDYVTTLAQFFKDTFEALGGTVEVFEAYSSSMTDFTGLLGQVADADVDVLFLPDYYNKVNVIADQADAMGLQVTLLGGDGWDSPSLDLAAVEGGYYSTHFSSEDPRLVVQDFVDAYSTTHGTQPDALAALGYDAAGILLQSLADAGVDDTARVRDAMSTVSFEGATGPIMFDRYGDPLKKAALVKIEGGETHVVRLAGVRVAGLAAGNDGPTNLGNSTMFTATVETKSPPTYTWAFGDGTYGSGGFASHTYATAGTYTAVLTASSEYNQVTTESVAVVRETLEISGGATETTSDGVLSVTAAPELTETLSMTYTPQATTTSSPGDFEVAGGITFNLDVRDEEGNEVGEPSSPLTLTVAYDEAALPAYLHEEDLEVRRYDGDLGDWVALTTIERDLVNDRLIVLLDHFSEFALLGPVRRVYLPLVVRGR